MIFGIADFMPPELVKILMEMGHGDRLVLCDRNFPAITKSQLHVRCDNMDICTMLDEILRLIPLDYATPIHATLMQLPGNMADGAKIHEDYKKILVKYNYDEPKLEFVPRQSFYDIAKSAFVVVETTEKRRFSNIAITKGVFLDEQI
jgi:L-fucose mutarotase